MNKTPRYLIRSARGIISLLDDELPQWQALGVVKLDKIVGTFWPEIAEALPKIERLYADPQFSERKLAALLASKVYFNLGDYGEAINMALCAEDKFDTSENSLYVKTIISKAIDKYVEQQKHNAEVKSDLDKVTIDKRLEALVDRMVDRCLEHKRYQQAIGIAFESHRLDMLKKVLTKASKTDQSALLSYCMKNALAFIQNRKYRSDVLKCLANIYAQLQQPDYINICQCFIFLEDSDNVAKILEDLIKKSMKLTLVAYQIAFDLYESATQQYLANILKSMHSLKSKEQSPDSKDKSPAKTPVSESETQNRLSALISILSGDETVKLHLQFFIKNNKTDMLILKSMREVVRTSVIHNAVVVSNGFMHCGTTCDDFLRENLEWVGKASNWAKFTAVASLGMIHKGHETDAMKLMEPYLPKQTPNASSGYVEGGGLYALGMIHANHGNEKIIDYLKLQLLNAGEKNNVKHGACLGLGLAAMGTHNQDVYEQLRACLYLDDAVTGEAASLAMGLVMLGSKASRATQEMTAYAAETQHDKTLRGLCVGISLLNYGRLEEATTLIETLRLDKDPNMRRSAVYTLAMAYCGTGSSAAVRNLLHVSVSDVNDDVRRAAVTCLGFLFCKMPEQCPPMVALLAESFNSHVRYGAAMALGIACAGTANKDALGLLDTMMNDSISYVRQGALIATSMILMQHNEVTSSKVKDFRSNLTKIINDKHEEAMTKFGAIVGHGILDAAGRNATLNLQTRNGHMDTASVVGVLVFLQYWFWFPFTNFLALSFRPTCLIALNSDLKMPKLEFRSNAKPSQFAYPAPLEEKRERLAEKVETAILSITAKQKKKEKEKQKSTSSSGQQPAAEKTALDDSANRDKTEENLSGGAKETPAKAAEPEATFQMLNNPARVLNQQLKHITFSSARYEPLKNVSIGGIIMLEDKEPNKSPPELVELVTGGGARAMEDDREAPEPQPFLFH